MIDIRNRTPFASTLIPALDKTGHDYAVVIIKGCFTIGSHSVLEPSEQQKSVVFADEYHGDPDDSSVKYESESAILKETTDIIVNGHAYAPSGRPTDSVDVNVSIEGRCISRCIFGDRFWEKHLLAWQPTPPEEFIKMPLIYENAYGGVDAGIASSETSSCLTENPVGKGFIGKKSKPQEGIPLPNIENPESLIEYWYDRPVPVGFGSIGRSWQPRRELAGTYDEEWQKKRMPLLPMNFNDRYFNSAHPDFIMETLLNGDESFRLENMNESGELSFRLPEWQLDVAISMKGKTQSYRPKLDTVVVEPDDNQVLLIWRATIPCFRQFLYIDSIIVDGEK